MIAVGVLGATGRMGRQVVDLVVRASDLRLAAAITHSDHGGLGQDAGTHAGAGPVGVALTALSPQSLRGCDVAIDFSTPAALAAALAVLGDVPLVTGTTGVTPEVLDRLTQQAQVGPVLVASNFSTGIAVLTNLVRRAARALPDYDLEIVEAHHHFKRDAPSGTALSLGRAAAEARGQSLSEVATHGRTGERQTGEIGFHAVRGGGIIGEHDVWLCGQGERLRLSHSAIDRSTFAEGSLRAARWLVDQPAGRYTLADALGLTAT